MQDCASFYHLVQALNRQSLQFSFRWTCLVSQTQLSYFFNGIDQMQWSYKVSMEPEQSQLWHTNWTSVQHVPIHTFFRHSHTTSCRKLKQCLQLIPLLVLDQTIADPVSAIGILGAIRGLLNLTAHAIKGLHTLHSSYNGATDTLRLITDNCLLLDLAVKQLNP